MTRRPLALLATAALGLTVALSAPAATAAPAGPAGPCQPESCPPPCPFHGALADLLCPQPV
jgi:hypothetical protein